MHYCLYVYLSVQPNYELMHIIPKTPLSLLCNDIQFIVINDEYKWGIVSTLLHVILLFDFGLELYIRYDTLQSDTSRY